MMVFRGLAAAALGAVGLAGCGGAAGGAPPPGAAAARGAAAAAAAARPAVPILLYHHLDDPPAGDPHASLWVTPRRFAAQLRALRRAGFHAVTLARVRRAWRGGARLPAR